MTMLSRRKRGRPLAAGTAGVPTRRVDQRRRRRLLPFVAAVAMAVLAVGCDTSDADPTAPDSASSSGTDGEAVVGLLPIGRVPIDEIPTEVDLSVLEGLPVLSGLAWAIEAIGPDGPPAVAEIEAAVSADFLAIVPAEGFIEQTEPLVGDWRITALLEVEPTSLVAEITNDGEQLLLMIEMSEDEPLEIELMGLQLPMGDAAEFDNWDEATAALTALGEEVVFLAATVVDEECMPIAAHNPDQRGPLGSTFKLYVLGALIDAVSAGEMAWNDELEITDELKSLPSGRLQIEDEGTMVTVAEAAELMISISDNTATDMLINALGRDTIEAAQADYGHANPSVNQPFLTTRELFQLAGSPEATAAFIAADEEGRRQVLAELANQPLPDSGDLHLEASVPQPIEWFASPNELCDLLVLLDEATGPSDMQPARDAFGSEPPPPGWDLIGAKAGGQPGVQTRTWLLDQDGTRFAFVVSIDHGPEFEAEMIQLYPVLEGVLNLMATETL